jgi:hypothetical protein
VVDRIWQAISRAKAVTVSVAAVAVTAVCCVVLSIMLRDPEAPAGPPPVSEAQVPGLCGWAGPEIAKGEFDRLKGKFENFRISTADGQPAVVEDRRSVLSEAAQKVLGHHIPTLRQEVGDCVSMGAANACMYLLAVQISAGEPIEFKDVFPPYLYGTSRVQVGKGRISCRSDGSVGSWAATAVMEYGAISSDAPGVPSYSGQVARDWGCKGPPKPLLDLGKKSLVQSAAKVRTWQEARDAIISGYPITIASGVGFKMSGTLRGEKLFLQPSGQWMHQMVVIGYDLSPEVCFLILNSWGPDAHTPVNQDGPPGSFWVNSKTMQRILDADDSYAYSAFAGFPAQEWDLDVLKLREAHHEPMRPGRAIDPSPLRIVSAARAAGVARSRTSLEPWFALSP